VGLLSFGLAVTVSYISGQTLTRVPAVVALLFVLLLVVIGISFDIVGTSVTAAEQSPLNAMAAKRVNGARQALWLVRNADKVSNFTNDVIGDVTGAVSGAAGATVAINMTHMFQGGTSAEQLMGLAVIGVISFLTVGGKAAGKTYALERSTDVVVLAGRIISGLERMTGRSFTGGRGPNSSRRRTT
jgi:CBS domain containing-hemolysin-like protein